MGGSRRTMSAPASGKSCARVQTNVYDRSSMEREHKWIQSRNDLLQEKVRWQVAPDVRDHEVFRVHDMKSAQAFVASCCSFYKSFMLQLCNRIK